MRFGVIGDVHANARALHAALAQIHTRPVDRLVFLGDLLSYGTDTDEVLSTVAEQVSRGAVLLLGNHDRLYLDLLAERAGGRERGPRYYDGLPTWLRESVDWTIDRFDPKVLLGLPYVPEYQWQQVVFAHANPYPAGPTGVPDWRYVNKPEDHALAAKTLRSRGLRVGVFGHTHRSRIVEWPSGRGMGDDARRSLHQWVPETEADALVINAGAIGQPRNRTATSTVLWLTVNPSGIDADLAPLTYDVEGHLAAVRKLPMSPMTVAALVGFFRAETPG